MSSGGVGGRALRKKDTGGLLGGRGVETYTVFFKKTYFLGFFLEFGVLVFVFHKNKQNKKKTTFFFFYFLATACV